MSFKQKHNILIVDDTPKNIQLLGETLSTEGYDLTIAQNGQQALDSVNEFKPDLILLDVMMPVINGLETCKILQANPETKDIPIIFLTAKTDTADIVKGFELGAVDYIIKPFQAAELLSRVRTHLALQDAQRANEKQTKEMQELVHILSHDLANHIQSLLMILHATDGNPDAFFKARPHIQNMAENGQDIVDLVRQMRGISEGKTQLQLKDVNLDEAVTESILSLNQFFIQKKVIPIIDIDKELFVHAEKTSLTNSVVNNLLTNAIKFSFKGSEIKLKAYQKEEKVYLHIQDRGIGIPDELLENIFDMNKATNRAGTGEESGTGFGMPLVLKFMEAYGGSISIKSKTENEFPEDHGTDIQLCFHQSEETKQPHG